MKLEETLLILFLILIIKDFIENMEAKHIFLLADACFSGTFLTRTRGSGFDRSYIFLDSRKSRWMLASGGEKTVADGPIGKGSPFAQNLLNFLDNNSNKYASVLEIIRYVSVLTSHNSRQQPKGAHIENIGHNGGEMILILDDKWVKTNIQKTNGQPQTQELAKEMRTVYGRRSKLSAGKEIILVDSFINADDLLVWECFRFDDQGNKKIKFQGNKAKLPAKDDPNFEMSMYRRFATWEGFNRYWDENKQDYEQRKIAILGATDEINHVEETANAIHQQEIIQDLFDANEEPMRCLHCNNMISTNDSYLVEIDEIGLKENVGNVHTECLRPADRILGKATFDKLLETNLINFDHKRWLELLKKGQAFLYSAKKSVPSNKIPILAWNRKHNFNVGDFCVNMIFEDGSSKYVRLGKQIHRFSADEIDEKVNNFNKIINEAEEQKNPIGITTGTKIFGSFSELMKIIKDGENFLKVTRYEKSKYSLQIDTIDNSIENDYTPLGLIIDPVTKEVMSFGNLIPLISDPTQFENLHKNWNKVGFKIEKCALRIIEDDKDLDLHLIHFFSDGMQPIVDPYFNSRKELVQGVLIKDIEVIKQQSKKQTITLTPNGTWKAGDRVKIVFPNVKTDTYARCILLTDEFYDESDEACIIFRPIEDGVVRDDMQFKMPTRLLVRD